jgi:hypothetical protein
MWRILVPGTEIWRIGSFSCFRDGTRPPNVLLRRPGPGTRILHSVGNVPNKCNENAIVIFSCSSLIKNERHHECKSQNNPELEVKKQTKTTHRAGNEVFVLYLLSATHPKDFLSIKKNRNISEYKDDSQIQC